MRSDWRARAEALLARHWWRPRPTALMQLLRPLSWLYALLAALARRRTAPQHLPVPVLVVGNLIAGGAGKTPTVIALVRALRLAGWTPGVISRGHGRRDGGVRVVDAGSDVADVGDEPLLIQRRSGAAVWVGRDRVAAARALCAAEPAVDILVADDGRQHRALPRAAEVLVFDDRGSGNGLLLPAGPLRERLPSRLAANTRVLYNAARPSTPLPGACVARHLTDALPLAAWRDGDATAGMALDRLRGRPLLAVAGLAAPERFFSMLEGAGLTIRRLALPDHYAYATLPWPAATPDVVTTEKDAIKLDPAGVGATRVWVVGLDLALPPSFTLDLVRRLGAPRSR